jgi:hypothetical protein
MHDKAPVIWHSAAVVVFYKDKFTRCLEKLRESAARPDLYGLMNQDEIGSSFNSVFYGPVSIRRNSQPLEYV